MRVAVRFHGIIGDLVRPKVEAVDLADGATVGDLLETLFEGGERTAAVLRQTHAFLDGKQADRATPLMDGATVTFMRPIAGG